MSEVEFPTGEHRKHLQQLDEEICKIVIGKQKDDINAYIKFSSACRRMISECNATYSRCDYLLGIAQTCYDKRAYNEINNYNAITQIIDESLSDIMRENKDLYLAYQNIMHVLNKLSPSFDYNLMKNYLNDLISVENTLLSHTIKLYNLIKIMSPTVTPPQYLLQMTESISTLINLV